MTPKEFIGEIELHDINRIQQGFDEGIDPNGADHIKSFFDYLISMYTRGPTFKVCVKSFVDAGLKYEDEVLLTVLLDDAKKLDQLLSENPILINHRVSLDCAYVEMFEVSLLHVCAEYNHVNCAKVLLKYGASVNATAGYDASGFGNQTPIFHTVNQNNNLSAEMMELLLENGADLQHTVKGLYWGKTYPWQTLIPAVNPISFAMMGLLPQFHRNEQTIHDVVKKLLQNAYDIDYEIQNVPNKYLLT